MNTGGYGNAGTPEQQQQQQQHYRRMMMMRQQQQEAAAAGVPQMMHPQYQQQQMQQQQMQQMYMKRESDGQTMHGGMGMQQGMGSMQQQVFVKRDPDAPPMQQAPAMHSMQQHMYIKREEPSAQQVARQQQMQQQQQQMQQIQMQGGMAMRGVPPGSAYAYGSPASGQARSYPPELIAAIKAEPDNAKKIAHEYQRKMQMMHQQRQAMYGGQLASQAASQMPVGAALMAQQQQLQAQQQQGEEMQQAMSSRAMYAQQQQAQHAAMMQQMQAGQQGSPMMRPTHSPGMAVPIPQAQSLQANDAATPQNAAYGASPQMATQQTPAPQSNAQSAAALQAQQQQQAEEERRRKEEEALYESKVNVLKEKYMDPLRRVLDRAALDKRDLPLHVGRIMEVFTNHRKVEIGMLERLSKSIPGVIEKNGLTYPVLEAIRVWKEEDEGSSGDVAGLKKEEEEEERREEKSPVASAPQRKPRSVVFPDPWPFDVRQLRVRVPDELSRLVRAAALDANLVDRRKRLAESRGDDSGPVWDARRMKYDVDLEEEFARMDREEAEATRVARGSPTGASPTGASPNENVAGMGASPLPPVVNSVQKTTLVENACPVEVQPMPVVARRREERPLLMPIQATRELAGLKWRVLSDDAPVSGLVHDLVISISADLPLAPPLLVLLPARYPEAVASPLYDRSFPASSPVHAQLSMHMQRTLSTSPSAGRLSTIHGAFRAACAALSRTSVRGALIGQSSGGGRGTGQHSVALRPPPKFLAPVENQKQRMVF